MMRRYPITAAVLALVGSGSLLVGCSSVKSMTCQEFGEHDLGEYTKVVWELIEERGLNPYSSVLGTASIGNDIYNFCGMSAMGGAATQNLDEPIDSAVDWSYYEE